MTAPTRKTCILTISIPSEMFDDIERLTEAEQCTISDLIQKAFRHYQFSRRWTAIRQWGTETAMRFDVENDKELEEWLG